MVYCIGLTGNIASGKSTVAQFFKQLGIAVLNADAVSRQLTSTGADAFNQIIAHFGSSVVACDGSLDRKELRELVFSNPDERIWLENLLHPLIRQQLEKEVSLCTGPYCIIEIPLLKNTKQYPYIKRVLLVTSPIDVQIERIIVRDHCTKEHALAILATQPSMEERINRADDIIDNNANLDKLTQEVNKLHRHYLNLAKNDLN